MLASIPKPSFPVLKFRNQLSNGLIGAWVMYEGGGTTVYDLSPLRNNGVMAIGAAGSLPLWSSSPLGTAINMNNATAGSINVGYVDVSNIPAQYNIGGNLSVAVWAKSVPNASGQTIASHWDSSATQRQWIVQTGQSNTAAFRGGVSADGGITNAKVYESSLTFIDGSYHFGVMTFSPGSLQIYIDGLLDVSPNKIVDGTVNSIFFSSVPHVAIGGLWQASGPGAAYTGVVVCFLMWNRTLSSSDVSSLYFDTFSMFRRKIQLKPAAAPPPATVLFRRSASRIGTRVGTRQTWNVT